MACSWQAIHDKPPPPQHPSLSFSLNQSLTHSLSGTVLSLILGRNPLCSQNSLDTLWPLKYTEFIVISVEQMWDNLCCTTWCTVKLEVALEGDICGWQQYADGLAHSYTTSVVLMGWHCQLWHSQVEPMISAADTRLCPCHQHVAAEVGVHWVID